MPTEISVSEKHIKNKIVLSNSEEKTICIQPRQVMIQPIALEINQPSILV